jgi:hypothetical protein
MKISLTYQEHKNIHVYNKEKIYMENIYILLCNAYNLRSQNIPSLLNSKI